MEVTFVYVYKVLFLLAVPPLSVEVEHSGSRYDAGASAEFRCRVSGSRPFPVVTWILTSRKIESFFNDISTDDDGTYDHLGRSCSIMIIVILEHYYETVTSTKRVLLRKSLILPCMPYA